jgi:Saxitoxin biosynthesis operon protein SxtJ
MALIERYSATRTELKWFGLMFAGFAVLLGGLAWWRTHHTLAVILWSIGCVVVVIYYAVRAIRRPFFDLWMAIAYPIGWVVSHVIIALVFYLLITPIGLMMRLLRRDPMNRAFDRSATTYWVPHDPSTPAARYFKQF